MSTLESILDSARVALQPWASQSSAPEANRLDLALTVNDLLPAVAALVAAKWGYLAAITGLDLGGETNDLEALYHFCSGPAIVTLRIRLPREAAALPSLCALIPSATLFERELAEMLGISMLGATDTSRLYLPDDWPTDIYPLRKDAVLPENNHARS